MEEHGNPLQQRSASGPQPPSAFVLQVGAGALMHICCSLPARAAPKGRTSAPCRTGKVTSGRTCYTLSSRPDLRVQRPAERCLGRVAEQKGSSPACTCGTPPCPCVDKRGGPSLGGSHGANTEHGFLSCPDGCEGDLSCGRTVLTYPRAGVTQTATAFRCAYELAYPHQSLLQAPTSISTRC